ncbi:MAG: PucC family protein, partial [Caulobacteraceae bacterium]|nr:PucC family protein [Caulobacter sp.]
IASMMQLVGAGGPAKEGVRMGLWGAAQACAFGAGGLAATILSDTARRLVASTPAAYASVFAVEAAIFLVAAGLAARLAARSGATDRRAAFPSAASLRASPPRA